MRNFVLIKMKDYLEEELTIVPNHNNISAHSIERLKRLKRLRIV